jgi:hypothetical protein
VCRCEGAHAGISGRQGHFMLAKLTVSRKGHLVACRRGRRGSFAGVRKRSPSSQRLVCYTVHRTARKSIRHGDLQDNCRNSFRHHEVLGLTGRSIAAPLKGCLGGTDAMQIDPQRTRRATERVGSTSVANLPAVRPLRVTKHPDVPCCALWRRHERIHARHVRLTRQLSVLV